MTLKAKETVIGLSVIGVLSSTFGTLLFQKLTASDVAAMPDQVAELAQAAADSMPQIVVQERQSPLSTSARPGAELSPASEPAARSFMPAEETSAARHDRYAENTVADEPAEPAAAPAAGNPFRRAPAREVIPAEADDIPPAEQDEPQRVSIESSDATPLEAEPEPTVPPRRYPVQQAQAHLSRGDDPTADEIPSATGAADPAEQTETPAEPAEPVADPVNNEIGNVEAEDSATASTPMVEVPSDGRDLGPREEIPSSESEPRRAAPPQEEPNARWQTAEPAARAVTPEPDRPANGKYTVGPNDTLWSVSEKVYGTGGYFKALYEHNRSALPDADRLTVGTVLSVPAPEFLAQQYPGLCPKPRKSALVRSKTVPASSGGRRPSAGNVYVVNEGDTLFDIARYELGKASRWAEIYELNRELLGEDFDYLRPGIELTMPPKGRPTDNITRQPSDSSRR